MEAAINGSFSQGDQGGATTMATSVSRSTGGVKHVGNGGGQGSTSTVPQGGSSTQGNVVLTFTANIRCY